LNLSFRELLLRGRTKDLIGRLNRSVHRKLTLAITVMASLSLLAGLISWISFSRTEQALEALQAQSLSDIRQVMELANVSAGLNARAPALTAAASLPAADAAWTQLQEELESFTALTSKVSLAVRPGGFLPTEVPAIVRLRDRLHNMLYNLYLTQKDRLTANATLSQKREALLSQLGDIDMRTATPLAAYLGLMSQALSANNITEIRRLEAIFDEMRQTAPLAQTSSGNAPSDADVLSIFALRRAAISADMRSQVLLTAVTVSSGQIETTIHTLADMMETSALERGEKMVAVIASGKSMLILGAGGCLLAALFVARRMFVDVVAKLTGATVAMTSLAAGNKKAEVPGIERPDEIGDLARAFRVFKAQATEKEELTSRLAESALTLTGIFDNMADGMALFDRDGTLKTCNPRLLALCSFDASNLDDPFDLAALFNLLSHSDGAFRMRDGSASDVQALGTGVLEVPQGLEYHFTQSRILSFSLGRIPDGSLLLGISDVTEQKRMERQVRHASKMEALGQLTGGIAHDFNNFLAAISGNLQLISDETPYNSPMRQRALRALDAVDSGAAMVDRLLAFARKQELISVPTSLNALVLDLVDLMQLSIDPAIILETDLTADLPCVLIDPHQMEDAILNLVFNARDALKDGGRISLSSQQSNDGMVSLLVKDNGAGMSAHVMARVFEPFFTTKTFGAGNGLGMSMVYGFIRQAGGDIFIDSEPGQGTTVRLDLPISDGAYQEEPIVSAPAYNGPSSGREREKILVLEDDARVRKTAVELIESLGFSCVAASTGQAAIDAHADGQFDLLFTDMILGNGDKGTDIAHVIKTRQPEIAVLLCSGYAGEPVTDDTGAIIPVLKKPYRREKLAEMLELALGAPAAAGKVSTSASNI
jgi:signal transduction histidine kinase/CheY-like chemotaxis protein